MILCAVLVLYVSTFDCAIIMGKIIFVLEVINYLNWPFTQMKHEQNIINGIRKTKKKFK